MNIRTTVQYNMTRDDITRHDTTKRETGLFTHSLHWGTIKK